MDGWVRRHGGFRSAALLGGLGVVLVALSSPLEDAAHDSLTGHMVQHLLLTAMAAPLIVVGRPLTLALRAGAARRSLVRLLRSRTFAVLTHPVVGWTAFVGTMYAVHLGPLYEAALRSPAWHAAEHSLFLGTALLFWLPVVGETPAPHALSHGARLLYLALAIPAEGFLSLALFSADRVLYPSYGGPGALADQQAGAALLWVVGDLVFVVALVIAAIAWKRDEEARQHRLEEGHAVRTTPAPQQGNSPTTAR